MSEHHNHHHSAGGIAMVDRHAHESETYDAMARTLLAQASDDELLVRSDRIPFANREHVEFLSFAIDRLRPLAGKRILEVGAGGGSLAVWLALQGAEVTGIDVSGGILEVARKRADLSGIGEGVRLIHCPIEDFDAPDNAFDAVIGNNVVHHFEREAAMSNLARILRPEGRAVFCEPVLFVPDIVRKARYAEVVTRRFPPHTHSPDERSLNRRDLAVMSEFFGSVSWRPFQMLCRLQNFAELSDPTWNRLEAIDQMVLNRFGFARWLSRIIVVTLESPRFKKSRREEVVTV